MNDLYIFVIAEGGYTADYLLLQEVAVLILERTLHICYRRKWLSGAENYKSSRLAAG